ncbi:MAG: hypothetical protein HYZ52_06405 [Candidatus Omnitrophica bacterium]|nr:hypothetical protein [Candidatus Omnitrophota bacterium]
MISVGIFVLFKNSASAVNRTFFFLTLSVFVWLFGYFMLYSTNDEATAKIIYKFLYTGVIFIPITFFHFTNRLLSTKNSSGKIFIQYLIGIFFVFSLYEMEGFLVGLQKLYWGYQTKAGYLNNLYLAYFFSIFIYCFILLRKTIQNPETPPEEKNRIRYVFWSFMIALIASTDWLPVYGIEYYPMGFIFITVFASTTTYAIVKHRLFDIDIIIRRSFIYSVLIFIITFIYLAIILISEQIFRSYFGYRSILIALTASLFIALVFNPLRLRIQNTLDKYFFKMDPEKILRENELFKIEAQKQDRMKSVATLATGMAHEIKNPLTAIKTFTEQLPARSGDPGFINKFDQIVTAEVNKIDSIVRQLLEFSKPTPPRLEPVLIEQILNETLDLLSGEFVKKNIRVEKKMDASDHKISGDKKQLKQVFLNLFLNSLDAMPGGGTLTVSTSLNSDSCLLTTVSDTGTGIAPEDLPHIFDPFFSKKQGGTGLGLSIVHGIIEEHGGKISAISQPGQGTTFALSFP